jgi:glycerol-3-phosphate acyltransferase PlsX
MEKPVRIALDAMGGDFGPSVIVPGADLFLQRHPEVRFLMFGDSAKVSPLLAAHPRLAAATTFRHTDVSVGMADKPSQALRSGRRRSSMWMTVEAVRSNQADCAVSAGNTGALMAMSKICLRTMAQIDRPRALGRSRRRRHHRRGRAALCRSRHHGRGHGEQSVRAGASDRRLA